VQKIFDGQLKGATTLPFAAFVTHKGRWVDGFSGAKNADHVKMVLEKAEKAPSLQASPDVRKKIAGLAKSADRYAKKSDWKNVVRAWAKASKLPGRCVERAALNANMKQAQGWADSTLASLIKGVQVGGETDAATKQLKKLKSVMSGSAYADDAVKGLKALAELKKIRKKEAAGKPQDDAREKVLETYAGTRWVGLYGEPEDEDSEIDISGD
jgi:hypothetical protein